MTRNKKIGLSLLLGPFVLLLLVFSGYAVTSFIAMQTVAAGGGTAGISIIRAIFGLLGIVGFGGIFIGVPVGIYFLAKKDLSDDQYVALQQTEAYKNLTVEQIKYIHSWSWSAFFFTMAWAIMSRMYLYALLSIIPFVNLYAWFKMSADGRKMSWEEGKWDSFDAFRQRQKTTAIVVAILTVLLLVGSILNSYSASQRTNSSRIEYYDR